MTGSDPLRVRGELVVTLDCLVRSVGGRLLVVNTGRRGEERLTVGRLFHRLGGRGVRCLGVDQAMVAARKAAPREAWDYGSDSHWNVAAHALAAELVRADLAAAGWLAPP